MVLAPLHLYTSAIDPKFDYQLYLDFALNRGQFAPHAQHITIPAKDSSHTFMLPAPMPDFSAANSLTNARESYTLAWRGEFTNIGLGYALTAAHMFAKTPQDTHLATRGSALNFGGITNVIVDYKDPYWGGSSVPGDFAVLKMDKFNLNAHATISPHLTFTTTHNPQGTSLHDKYTFHQDEVVKLADSNRYILFAREGAGTQMLGYEGQGASKIERSDIYHTGGLVGFSDANTGIVRFPFTISMENYDWRNNNLRIPFSSSSAPGDSGSALYVYDTLDSKWYLIGVVSSSDCGGNTGDLCSIVEYSVIHNALIDEFRESKSLSLSNGTYRFSTSGQLLDSSGRDMGASVLADSVAGNLYWTNINDKSSFNQRIQAMQDNKDISLSGSGTLRLEKDIDLGAGGLVFGRDSVWSIEGADRWFVHGGIYTDSGSSITYDVKTLDNDFLHKVGSGILRITSSSPNAGLRVGEGSVELNGNALSFKEIYLVSGRGSVKITDSANINTDYVYFGARGGSLDMNGNSLTFGRIFASDNGAHIINSSYTPATLTLTQTCGGANTLETCVGTQDYLYHGNIIAHNGGIHIESGVAGKNLIFDGNIDNTQGVMRFSDGSLTFQGHPKIHAYINVDSKTKLDSLHIGQNVFTSPTSFSQEDWEHRIFSLKELAISNATFSLAHNASLHTTLNAHNATITLGSTEVWLDFYDGENVITRVRGGRNNDAGNPSFGVGSDMRFIQTLKKGEAANATKQNNVFFSGTLNLHSSTATLNAMQMSGDIRALSGANTLRIIDSTMQGGISNAHNAAANVSVQNATILGDIVGVTQLTSTNALLQGNIHTDSLSASFSTFRLRLDVGAQQTERIVSNTSTQGGNNTLLLYFLNAPNASVSLPNSLLLASLRDSTQSIDKEFFSIPAVSEGFSVYTPNVRFSHDNERAEWSLERVGVASDTESYFSISPNTESINRANALFNQVLLGYVIEWNNLQKRMGELRENPKVAGAWIRTFGGGSSESNYRGNFFEAQLGGDYQLGFRGGSVYVGGMFSYTRNLVQGVGANAQSNGYGVGAYASALFDNGLYIDSVLRYVYRNHEVYASFIPNGAGGASDLRGVNGANTMLFSLEGGYRLMFSDFFAHKALQHFYLEPQVELIAGYLQGARWQNANVSLELADSVPVSAKTALFVGKRFFFHTKSARSCAISPAAHMRYTHTRAHTRVRVDSKMAYNTRESSVDSRALNSHILESSTLETSTQASLGDSSKASLESYATESSAYMPSDCAIPQDSQSLGVRFGLGGAYDLHRYGARVLRDRSGARAYEGIADNRMFVNLSLDYVLNERLRLNLELERSFFGLLHIDWLMSANMRVGF